MLCVSPNISDQGTTLFTRERLYLTSTIVEQQESRELATPILRSKIAQLATFQKIKLATRSRSSSF